ncbi:hypothetical protein ACJMK2_028094 [Sinanodonta woodiana]|uniref:Uncharacterized protein n=1 Tax=Sinanodonta woodiana TaxID=1069815 RepID=A0ABD3X6B0_SINWO
MASGNKLMKEISDQFLHCKICLESYKDPKTLVCLHTFCSHCLQQHVDSDSSRSSRFMIYNRYITCPLCRRKTEIPSGGIKRLPDNFLLSSLTDAVDRRRPSKIPPCEICISDKRRGNEACSKCLDCTKLLCKSCVELHLTTRVTQNHSLIDIEGEKDIECKTHPEEIVRFYCEPCDECVCVVCTFQEHRDHEISSFSDGFSKHKTTLEALLSQCKDRLSDVQDCLSLIRDCESVLKDTRENIRDLAINYISQVRSTEKSLIQYVDAHFGGDVLSFLQNKEWLQENFEGLQSICNLGDIIMNDKGIEILLLKKELQSKLSTLLEPSLPPIPENLAHKIKFVPGSVKNGYLAVMSGNIHDLETGSEKGSQGDKKNLHKVMVPTQEIETQTEFPRDSDLVMTETQVLDSQHMNGITESANSKTANAAYLQRRSLSTSDVSVNTTLAFLDKGLQVFSGAGTTSSGICVKCCAELKKEADLSSIPVIDGDPPKIQDIIIVDSGDNSRRRRRSFIRSRRVQTDMSLIDDKHGDETLLRVSSHDSLSSSRSHSRSPLRSVSEPVDVTDAACDPIEFEPIVKKPEMCSKATLAKYPIRCVRMNDTMTNTDSVQLVDSATITYPQLRAFASQTNSCVTVEKGIATDYAGQRNKGTSTPQVTYIDNETTMPTLTFESLGTWTDLIQTTERSVITECCETYERGTDMPQKVFCEQGVMVLPETRTVDTITLPMEKDMITNFAGTDAEVAQSDTDKISKKEKEKAKKKEKEKAKKEKKNKKESLKVTKADVSTETEPVKRSDKETGTIRALFKDQWTVTPRPQMINTGISPARPATMEASVTTNPVTQMDQSTYTEFILTKDSQTETVIVVADNETLTERVNFEDAQTSVDITMDTNETMTEAQCFTEAAVETDNDLFTMPLIGCKSIAVGLDGTDTCQIYANMPLRELVNIDTVSMFGTPFIMSDKMFTDRATSPSPPETKDCGTMAHGLIKERNLMDRNTQTSLVAMYDKSIATSGEFEEDAEYKGPIYTEAATMTDSQPYIGLLSEMDVDEIFLVPEIALDFSNYSSYGALRAFEENFVEEMMTVCEAGTQTLVSSALIDIDSLLVQDLEEGLVLCKPREGNLVDVAVNTVPKLTFEKETSTPIRHLFSTSTMTMHFPKTDKSTNTGHMKAYAEAMFGEKQNSAKSPRTSRASLCNRPEMKDMAVVTDSSLLDEKMLACINKLKNVSERLHSPTSKSLPEPPPWNKNADTAHGKSSESTLNKTTEDERRKNVMELLQQTSTLLKQKDGTSEGGIGRKAQPITTLKGKGAISPNEHESLKSKVGNQANNESRLLHSRHSSAPGRIATVPAQMMRKSGQQSPKVQSKIPVSNKSPPSPESPDFYSTVPKTRHHKRPLPAITETRTPSSCSDSSNSSFVSAKSANSNSSSDKAMDFSSLKITVPPARQSNQGGKLPPAILTTVEVIPTLDVVTDTPDRERKSSSSSEQLETAEPQQKKGFIEKLFSKKKKTQESRPRSPSKSPRPVRKAQSPEDSPKEAKKSEKPKPFVYMRSRIFSIQQDNEDQFKKQTVSKYCLPQPSQDPPVEFATSYLKK